MLSLCWTYQSKLRQNLFQNIFSAFCSESLIWYIVDTRESSLVPCMLGISILCFFIDCTFLFLKFFCPHPHWKMLEIMGIFRCYSPFLFTNKHNWNVFMSSWPYTKQSPKDKGSIGVHDFFLSILIFSNGDLNFYWNTCQLDDEKLSWPCQNMEERIKWIA